MEKQKVSSKGFFKKVREVFKRKNPMEDEVSFPERKRRFAFRSTVAGLTFLMLTPFISKGVQDVLTFFNTDYTKMPSAVAYAQDERKREKPESLKHWHRESNKWDIVDTVEVSKEDVDKAYELAPKYELKGLEKEKAMIQLMGKLPRTDEVQITRRLNLLKKMAENMREKFGRNPWREQVNNTKVFRIPVESQWGDKFIITVGIELSTDFYYVDALIEREGQTEKPLKIVLPWVAYSQLLGIDTDEIIKPSNGINSIKIGLDTYQLEEKRNLKKGGKRIEKEVLTVGISIMLGLNNKNEKNPYNGFGASVEISIPKENLNKTDKTLDDYFYYSPDALIYYKAKEPLTLSKR